jgi:hypothetical protein
MANNEKQKKALAKARKMKFEDELKNVTEKERPFTKAYLAQRLHEVCHFDLELCNQTLDALCAELFPEAPPARENEPPRSGAPRYP